MDAASAIFNSIFTKHDIHICLPGIFVILLPVQLHNFVYLKQQFLQQ